MSTRNEWPPAVIAAYDQALADADTELDRLVRTLQMGTAKVGERQAMANVGALLHQQGPDGLVGLLSAALRRMAAQEQQQ